MFKSSEDFLNAADPQIEAFLEEVKPLNPVQKIDISAHQTNVQHYVDETIDYFSDPRNAATLKAYENGTISEEKFNGIIVDRINSYFDIERLPEIVEIQDETEKEDKINEFKNEVFQGLQNYLWGSDILTPLVNDPDISDIRCLSHYNIRYKKKGKRYQAKLSFMDEMHYERFIKRLATRNQISLSDQNAVQNFTDANNHSNYILRYNISTKLVNDTSSFFLHIRKVSKTKKTVGELVEEGMITKSEAAFFIDAVRKGKSFLVCGKGGAGKTTLINSLIEYLDDQVSVECIQENSEIFSISHPEFLCQHTVTTRGEGKYVYELKDLARNSLTADIDMFIIGETKGEEARYLFIAANTGAAFITTLHAENAEEALYRLADYVKYDSDYSAKEVMRAFSVSTDYVIFLENYYVKEILKVTGFDEEEDRPIYQKLK